MALVALPSAIINAQSMLNIGPTWFTGAVFGQDPAVDRLQDADPDNDQTVPGIRLELYGSPCFGFSAEFSLVGTLQQDGAEPVKRVMGMALATARVPLVIVEPYAGVGRVWVDDIQDWQARTVSPMRYVSRLGIDLTVLGLMSVGFEVNFLYADVTEMLLYGWHDLFNWESADIVTAFTVKLRM